MFAKISRYRKLLDLVTVDADGRQLESKEIRILPKVESNFLHTVEELDRLDHLAYKYYKQPRKWWRICDANPDFMSPLALLGKDPVVSVRFELSFNDSENNPPWSELLNLLSEQVGIENIKIEDEINIVAEEQTIANQQFIINTEQPVRAVEITFNQVNIKAEDLANVIISVGFVVEQRELIERVGKSIMIPRNIVG